MHTARSVQAIALLAALGCVLDAGAARAAASATNRYVMVVAHNRSQDKGVKPLRYADDDGVRYWELFRLTSARVALFSVLDEETAGLYRAAARAARPPTKQGILEQLTRWNREMEADRRAGRSTELYFIYAGHGDVDASGEGYVNLLRSKLRRRDLYQQLLAPSRASFVHLIIDACKSYFMVNRRGGEWKDDSAPRTHDAEIKAFLNREDLASYPQVGVVLATSGDQSTHEWSRFRGGILSHGLRSALSGPADINGDGRVEYSELHAFLAASTSRVRHPEARLNVFARPPAANRHRPLMDLRAASRARLLRFGPRVAGKIHVQDDRGIRYADLHKAPGTRFDMAVDSARTYYIHRSQREARVKPGRGRVQVSTLSFSSSPMAMRGSIEQSFRKDLFRTAYSRGFYDGFCTRTGLPPVEGGAVEFIIRRPDDEDARLRRHGLLAGYMVGGALLDLDGVGHGVSLAYEYGLHRHVALGATLQWARSGHDNPAGQAFHLDRVAVLVGAAARTRLFWRVSIRAELNLGYQGYFGSGPVYLKNTNVGGSSDALGFRMEAGAGLRVSIPPRLFVDLRGGAGLDLVTLELADGSSEQASFAPYGGLAIGARF